MLLIDQEDSDDGLDPELKAFYDNYNQEEQDKKDREWVLANKAKNKEDDERAAIEFQEKDKEIFNYFDVKFYADGLENEYQLDISDNPNSLLDFHANAFTELYIRIRKDGDVIHKSINGKPFKIVTDEIYVENILDYHFNYCNGDKKTFLTKLVAGIRKHGKIIDKPSEFEATANGMTYLEWVKNKREDLRQSPVKPSDSATKSSFKRGKVSTASSYSELFETRFKGHEEKFDEVLLIEKLIDSERNWIGKPGAARFFWIKMIEAGVFKPMPDDTAAIIFANTFAKAKKGTFKKVPPGEHDDTSGVAKKYKDIPVGIQSVINSIKTTKS